MPIPRSALLIGSLLGAAACTDQAAPVGHLQVSASVDTLPNGLRVIVHEDHSAPTVAVHVRYQVGSGDEVPGRTGFAHLFEHVMFMGSQHAPYPQFDLLLEGAGASNNGTTNEDRTVYYESGPVNALPLMLWLEADRMGWLLPTMDQSKLDGQRDVVKNERRERVEDSPYGLTIDALPRLLFPAGHPYSWSVIGSMADLSAASLEDVQDFFRQWYAPNNAVIVVAGAVRRDSVLALTRTYFGDIPPGEPIIRQTAPVPVLAADTAEVHEDRVQAALLTYAWPTPAAWSSDEAALSIAAQLLTGAKNARLTRRLVYQDQSAANTSAYIQAQRQAGRFVVVATAKPGGGLPPLQQAIDEEIRRLAEEGPSDREMEQARNSIEADFLRDIQRVLGKAGRLNTYYAELGTPDAFQRDLDRHLAVTRADVQRVVTQYLLGPRVILSVVPQGSGQDAAIIASPRSTP